MNFKPESYPSMSPYLICADGPALLTFVEEAFGGELLRRFDRPDGSLMHAEIQIDDSVLMIGGGVTPTQSYAPHIHIYVRDVKAVFRSALAAGATSIQEPIRESADDDLRGGVMDPSGTTWWIASQ
ncbi:MAG TPA: VOC family protein [Marmoricola sp.]|nr:VOC family protein [Marmoricola sp.]HNI71272.1 VOC family protein [Marmoricola sp.]HNJ78599.1 VOC family protein [Marmoricola sp.]